MSKIFLILFLLLTFVPFIFGTFNRTVVLPIKLDKYRAVFKDNIRISCDSPSIVIKSWVVKTEPVVEYLSSFRKNKKVYMQDIEIDLELEVLTKDDSKLYISFLALDSNNKIIPSFVRI